MNRNLSFIEQEDEEEGGGEREKRERGPWALTAG